MWRTFTVLLLTVVLTLAVGACSARTQLALEEEQQNGAHFATWNHMGYSVRRGTPDTTTKGDITLSQADRCLPNQTCKWWGEPISVQPIQ